MTTGQPHPIELDKDDEYPKVTGWSIITELVSPTGASVLRYVAPLLETIGGHTEFSCEYLLQQMIKARVCE